MLSNGFPKISCYCDGFSASAARGLTGDAYSRVSSVGHDSFHITFHTVDVGIPEFFATVSQSL